MEMMKGLVAYPTGDLKLEEVKVPVLGENPYAPHDVLIEVQYCGICGSDIHRYNIYVTPYLQWKGEHISQRVGGSEGALLHLWIRLK